ncbi:MAG: 2-amino-4-hydroxy-6-hydroxymethyldihydropteridine diphosphokinase [Gammaproteobacteria bacterium]|nr:2-amino-4-hydroxy-6-hydroxymethyldihydropteridine diphosphokinase [Gammaproteobacteria bacterium]NND48415.1 2-amino-4-hydroxy-6-hydroxymethyldihydropteridine diphosphokinase [Woeseiaceae bacterium]NNL45159.1 2-amino-4-hydroxy-6-hydroxymethyldihydropteridine diphosphokinase [Woeseiaceae bacterium]
MSIVYLGLGSNIRPEENLSLAVRELRRCYGDLDVSSVYRGAAIGFEGDDFLNLVVRLRSEQTPVEICREIERLHDLAGRDRGNGKWSSRPLDIDLLLYDDQVIDERPVRVPRSDILKYSFVLRPLAELAPDLVHPVTGKSMLAHWQEFDAASQPLELVGIIL